MGMEAAGAYLQGLRDARGLSRARLAREVGTTENNLWRIESGRQEPGGYLLTRLLRVLHGSWEVAERLIGSSTAQAADGQQAAIDWLAGQDEVMCQEIARLATLPAAQRDEASTIILRLADLLESGHSAQDALRIVTAERELGRH